MYFLVGRSGEKACAAASLVCGGKFTPGKVVDAG